MWKHSANKNYHMELFKLTSIFEELFLMYNLGWFDGDLFSMLSFNWTSVLVAFQGWSFSVLQWLHTST